MLVFKWLSEKIEKDFRDIAFKLYGKRKGAEKHAFTDIINFFKSEIGQASFKEWIHIESQKDLIE